MVINVLDVRVLKFLFRKYFMRSFACERNKYFVNAPTTLFYWKKVTVA